MANRNTLSLGDRMKKFNEIYFKIINEIKYITSPNKNYKINDEVFTPVLYNNICIAASSLNSDKFHVLNQLKTRSNNEYSLNDVITIIKRYIDKDPELKNIFKDKNRTIYSCSIQSKEFNKIKVQVMFELNEARDIFSSGIENAKYFCFVYTVLSNDMKENKNDKILLTESISLEVD